MREAKGDANGRPDLAKALAAAGDAPVQLAVAPSADSRRVIEELLGRLPDEVGGGPATVLTRGVRWASLAVQLPPKPELRLIIQSEDADAAKALSDVINKGMDFITKEIQAGQKHNQQLLGARPPPDDDGESLVKALAALKPRQAGDRLELTLDTAAFERIGVTVVGGPVEQQRAAARRQVSASNLKQLVLLCLMWAEDHKGEWPDKLEDAAKKAPGGGVEKLLANPSHPGTGYVYVKPPARPKKGPSEVVVMYEAEPVEVARGAKALMVAFMDGHVEFMGEDGLKAKLKEQAGEK
jgi:prepilin-type processing-associated H-X9-DG protein